MLTGDQTRAGAQVMGLIDRGRKEGRGEAGRCSGHEHATLVLDRRQVSGHVFLDIQGRDG